MLWKFGSEVLQYDRWFPTALSTLQLLTIQKHKIVFDNLEQYLLAITFILCVNFKMAFKSVLAQSPFRQIKERKDEVLGCLLVVERRWQHPIL